MTANDEIGSLTQQLENKREHLLLIQERKSEYVLDTDIPLGLIKEERETEQEIADLEARIQMLRSSPTVQAPKKETRQSRTNIKVQLIGLGVIASICLIGVFIARTVQSPEKERTANPSPAFLNTTSSEIAPPATAALNPVTPDQPGNVENTAPPGVSFAPATLTPTPAPPLSINLTNNREGGYEKFSLLYDAQGILHLVFYSRLPRGGDYYHQQMSPDGTWTAPENFTSDFEFLWSDLVLALHPDGYICILWGGVTDMQVEAYYKRCQNDPGGGFSQTEIWQPHEFDTRAGFSPLLLAEDSVVALFNRVPNRLFIKDQYLDDGISDSVNPHLVQDAAENYHLVWFRQGDPYSLEYRASSDGGSTWSPTERLTTEATMPDPWFDLAADGAGNLHLVWPGFHGGLYYRRWTPAEGWRETVQLGSEGCEAEIAINRSGLARVVSGCWYGIFFYEQTPDSGWLAAYQVADQGRPLDLAVDKDDRVHIVYEKENDLFYITLATRQSGQ